LELTSFSGLRHVTLITPAGAPFCLPFPGLLLRGPCVGRIFRSPGAAAHRPWMSASGHNGDTGRAAFGYEQTREVAMAAFARSWRRE
jgi:hypothetical protein